MLRKQHPRSQPSNAKVVESKGSTLQDTWFGGFLFDVYKIEHNLKPKRVSLPSEPSLVKSKRRKMNGYSSWYYNRAKESRYTFKTAYGDAGGTHADHQYEQLDI
jgi:hypothetical protein